MNPPIVIDHVVDGVVCRGIESTSVPASPRAILQGNHLFVNVLFDRVILEWEPETILQRIRSDVLRILSELSSDESVKEHASICVSSLTQSNGELIRLHRYSIETSQLRSRSAADRHGLESSHMDSIQSLIDQRPSLETHSVNGV